MPAPKKPATPASPDIPRVLANALYACSFMTWKRVDGPTAPKGETVQVEAFEGKTDEELVGMTDGGVFMLDGVKSFSFDVVEARGWSVTLVRMREPGSPKYRYDGAAVCVRTGTMIHLGAYAKHAYGIALDLVDNPA